MTQPRPMRYNRVGPFAEFWNVSMSAINFNTANQTYRILRYNVIGGFAANEQERLYSGIAQRIASGEIVQPLEAVRACRRLPVRPGVQRGVFGKDSAHDLLAKLPDRSLHPVQPGDARVGPGFRRR